MSTTTQSLVPVECLICAETCEALAVFKCGHHVCYVCGLHIHTIVHGACPICREAGKTVIVTRSLPDGQGDEDQFSAESIRAMEETSVLDKRLQCYIHGRDLANEIAKTYRYVCPLPECWKDGEQEPFCAMSYLKEHLKVDHGLEYCPVCLEHRSVFLCEQHVYTKDALQLHMNGVYPQDTSSFLGHPSCRFCKNKRFYDEDYLLEHMRLEHFVCDVCNHGGFSFVYYRDRGKLLQHFGQEHMLCDHPDCVQLDPMVRVFASDLELAIHKHRVHGIRSRVPLSTGDMSGMDLTSASPTVVSFTAAGRNANVIRIVFDHVSRRETMELIPTRSVVSGSGGGKHWKKGGRKGDEDTSMKLHLLTGHGLPEHFRSCNILDPLKREKREQDVTLSTNAHSRAFGVWETMEAYNTKNKVPSNCEERQGVLDAVLREEIIDLHQLNDFRICTAEFMNGKILATNYYKLLRVKFFPSESAFNKIFPLLVATVPIPEKRDALVQIEKMQNSPEAQHAQRIKDEEAKKKKEEAKWKSQHELAKRLERKFGNQNRKNGVVRNVWLEKGGAGLMNEQRSQTTTTTTTTTQQQQQRHPSAWGTVNINNTNTNMDNSRNNRLNSAGVTTTSSNAWQTSPAQRPSLVPTTINYQEDFDNFPELPTTSSRRALRVPQSNRTKRPNAWHRN